EDRDPALRPRESVRGIRPDGVLEYVAADVPEDAGGRLRACAGVRRPVRGDGAAVRGPRAVGGRELGTARERGARVQRAAVGRSAQARVRDRTPHGRRSLSVLTDELIGASRQATLAWLDALGIPRPVAPPLACTPPRAHDPARR